MSRPRNQMLHAMRRRLALRLLAAALTATRRTGPSAEAAPAMASPADRRRLTHREQIRITHPWLLFYRNGEAANWKPCGLYRSRQDAEAHAFWLIEQGYEARLVRGSA